MHMQIIPKRTIDFSALGAGEIQIITLLETVDVSEWPQATLIVRVHEKTFGEDQTGEIGIGTISEAPSPQDPGLFFISTGEGAAGTTITAIAPAFPEGEPVFPPFTPAVFVDIPKGFGSHLRFIARGVQAGAGVGNAMRAVVSIDLVLKQSS